MKKNLLAILLACCSMANAQTPNFWHEKATGFATANIGLNSISIANTDVIWATATDNTLPLEPDYTIKKFTKSTDGGNTWTTGTIAMGANTAGLGISSISAISETTAWISAYPDVLNTTDLGGIWKTTDGGTSWTKQSTASYSSTDSFTNYVHFWDALNGVALGDPEGGEFEIYTTIDSGTNWTRVPSANIPDPVATGEFGIFNRFSVSGNTIWFGTDTGRIFKSADKGLNWTATQSQSTDFTYDRFTFSDSNNGLLTTYTSPIKLYQTTNGGSSWSEVTTTGQLHTDITYIPGTSTVVATDWKNPIGSSFSTDNGLNWTTIDAIPHGTQTFLNSSFGFSSGFSTDATTGGIFKFTGIPLKTSSFDANNQITAYPNPTNGLLQINSKVSLVKEATIYDLLGKKVYSSKTSPSSNVSLDLKSLQTGLYNLRVTSDTGKVENIKIMKN